MEKIALRFLNVVAWIVAGPIVVVMFMFERHDEKYSQVEDEA